MSLKTFTFPGKDSRCVRYNGCVYKIKSLLNAPNERTLSDYVDQESLQKEVEDIIRAVLAIPINVEPIVMRTEHLVVKPERKKWELPKKVGFFRDGRVLRAPPFMFVLNLQLIQEQSSFSQSKQSIHSQFVEEKEVEEYRTSSTKVASNQERPKRQHHSGDATIPSSKIPRRANIRITPSVKASDGKHRYVLRKRALKLSRRLREPRLNSQQLTPDDADLDGGRDEEHRLDEEETSSSESEVDLMDSGRGDVVNEQARGSPVLESGFSRLLQRNLSKNPSETKRREQTHSDVHHPSTGDQGPSPAKPSDEEVAQVGVFAHPGREMVEQHVLSEQLRLQQMAATAVDSVPAMNIVSTQQGQHKQAGMVKQMINAVVNPVKNLFSTK